jgi:hypothetical protein
MIHTDTNLYIHIHTHTYTRQSVHGGDFELQWLLHATPLHSATYPQMPLGKQASLQLDMLQGIMPKFPLALSGHCPARGSCYTVTQAAANLNLNLKGIPPSESLSQCEGAYQHERVKHKHILVHYYIYIHI